ncbi:MAG TPA: MBL fold metallo-hydrolase [Beijerinckiaceae bacterium]|jgi:glyoxylase-like metal-dependent hydrolase (beta-lactamase superfamily II)
MSLTRRTLLAAAPLAAAAPIGGSALAQSANPASTAAPPAAPTQQAPSFYRFKVGDFTVTAFHEGINNRPLDAGFVKNAPLEDVQKAAERAFLPKDRLPISFTTLLVNTGRNLVLIDTGFGDNGAASVGGTWRNLRAAGVEPGQIDTVIISHFHGDHITGVRLKDGSDAFPNAQVVVPTAEWAFWMDDAKMSAAPDAMKGAFQLVRRQFGPIQAKVGRYESGKEVVPGITALDASGHTPGHSIFAITSGNGRLLAVSDITNHPALFVRNPDWAAVFDMDADQARATRRRVLDMAASEKMQLAFYHAPFPAAGHVVKDGNGYEFVPVQWSSVL